MIYLLLLFLEIIFLFFLSRIVSKILSRFLPIHVLSVLFFPGVVVHELSHLMAAGILLVRVGEIEFRPKVTERGLKLGSVAIAKTDPVRRAIIGFAPVFVGLLIILGIMYFQSSFSSFWGATFSFMNVATPESGVKLLLSVVTFYLLFVISNTMFSSKADMEGTLELLMVALVVFSAFYFAGFRFPSYLTKSLFSIEIIGLVQKSSMFLLAPIIIDLIILGGIRLFRRK